MSTPLETIVQSLDNRILEDSSIGPELFARLLAAQRELGLLHGDRPTCPFLRPHILSRTQYEAIEAAAEIIARAFEKVVARALEHQPLLSDLGLTPAEEQMARIDPGYSTLCVTSRLDAYLTESGFQFLEYNAENPAGISDQMQLEKILLALPHMRDFLGQHDTWTPKPHERLLESLLVTYREWGGREPSPQIAIVDWEGVSTASEFEVLKQYFESAGYPTTIVDPRALDYDGQRLKAGTFRIDIVYKRVIIHEFLEKFDDTHPLSRVIATEMFVWQTLFARRWHIRKRASQFSAIRSTQICLPTSRSIPCDSTSPGRESFVKAPPHSIMASASWVRF